MSAQPSMPPCQQPDVVSLSKTGWHIHLSKRHPAALLWLLPVPGLLKIDECLLDFTRRCCLTSQPCCAPLCQQPCLPSGPAQTSAAPVGPWRASRGCEGAGDCCCPQARPALGRPAAAADLPEWPPVPGVQSVQSLRQLLQQHICYISLQFLLCTLCRGCCRPCSRERWLCALMVLLQKLHRHCGGLHKAPPMQKCAHIKERSLHLWLLLHPKRVHQPRLPQAPLFLHPGVPPPDFSSAQDMCIPTAQP